MCAVFLFAPVSAEAQQLRREHTIEIYVECIEAAREIINAQNGYNLDSHASFERYSRWANFTRRVDDWAFRHTQAVLRELGEVLHEHEHATFLGGEIANVETQIRVLSQEMERLSAMMAAADSLNVLIAVNDRLNNVARDRDALVGRREVLLSQAESSIIRIHLFETPPDPTEDAPPTFGERVSTSFLNSWNATRRTAENTLVFVVRISVPLGIWAAVVGVLLIAARISNKRKGAKRNEKK